MNQLLNIYKKFPAGLKDSLKYGYSFIPLRLRLGNKFLEQLKFIDKSQWWSEAELEEYQSEELQKLIRHAYNNVPYYNAVLKKIKLAPNDIKSIKDLPKLPILTKDIARENLNALRASNFSDKDVVRLNTSGTTGKPLLFYYDKDKEYLNFDPFIWRFFGWAGHSLGQIRVTFSSWTTDDKIYTYNPVRNLLVLSAYKMNAENVEEYAGAMNKYKIQYVDGYSNMFALFTSFLKEKGIKPPVKLQAFFSHSEYLHEWQRSLIKGYWDCHCFDWYGMEERVILAVECEKHEGMHLCSDFAITEFQDRGQTGLRKIISTSLTNYAMPFIRYDTEDVGTLNSKACSCTRGFPLITLHGGRKKSFAVAKDGSYIPVTNIDIPNVTDNVQQFQFIQEKQGELLLSIIKKGSFQDKDLQKINAKLAEKFGNNMGITIRFTATMYHTDNNKTPIFIQNIKETYANGIINNS